MVAKLMEGQDLMRIPAMLALLFATTGAAAQPAPAQPTPATGQATLPASIGACVSKVDDGERLRCYDQAVNALSAEARATAALREAEAQKAAAAAAGAAAARQAADAAKAEQDRQAAFGAERLRAGAPADVEKADLLEGTIAEVFIDSRDRAVIALDNGQIWRQTEVTMLPTIRPGGSVVLKRGALGSYRMTIASIKRTIPVTRIR